MSVIEKDSMPFKPYARLMNILGDQLITDKIVAVIELLKNCYDADSPSAEVRFGNMCNIGFNDLPLDQQAYIEIRDFGTGMTLQTIKNVWLRPLQPTQKAMEMGLFEIKKTSITKPSGDILVTTTTKVTGRGQIYFVNKFLNRK